MGFRDTLDSIKDKLRANPDDGYYDDGADDQDEWYDDGVGEPTGRSTGLLGNTSRPEPDSVSVYTRSGQPIDNTQGFDRVGVDQGQATGFVPATRARSYDGTTSRSTSRGTGRTRRGDEGVAPSMAYESGPESTAPGSRYDPYSATGRAVSVGSRAGGSQLPPYVLKPTSYNDVQAVLSRVRTGQPVVLALENTDFDTAKRILDFCFGLACGIDGSVDELADRIFAVQPAGVTVTQADLDKLVSSGIVSR